MNAEYCRTLADYHYWANERMMAVVDSLTPEQYAQDLGNSFGSIQATLAHMMMAERVWLNRMLGESEPLPGPEDVPTQAAARARWAVLERLVRTFVADLTDAALDREVLCKFRNGTEAIHSVREILPHLFNHGTYHRGQVTTMLRQLGATPASTDLIVYYREHK